MIFVKRFTDLAKEIEDNVENFMHDVCKVTLENFVWDCADGAYD